MDETAILNELAEAEIATLESGGIRLKPNEVVEINALCWAVHTPTVRKHLARGRPVECGTAILWPLTIHAVDWLDGNGFSLSTISPQMGYAMAHCYSSGLELDTYGAAAVKAVEKWYKKLRCTPAAFAECIRQVDDQDRKPDLPQDSNGKPMSLGDFSAFLTAVCGADADLWERRCSVSYALAVLTMVIMHNKADKKKCAQDPVIIAERAIGYCIDKIRARHALEQAVDPNG